MLFYTVKKQAADETNFFDEDPYKFSPFGITKYKFENVSNFKELRLSMEVKALHDFVVVKSVEEGAQAEKNEIFPGM